MSLISIIIIQCVLTPQPQPPLIPDDGNKGEADGDTDTDSDDDCCCYTCNNDSECCRCCNENGDCNEENCNCNVDGGCPCLNDSGTCENCSCNNDGGCSEDDGGVNDIINDSYAEDGDADSGDTKDIIDTGISIDLRNVFRVDINKKK